MLCGLSRTKGSLPDGTIWEVILTVTCMAFNSILQLVKEPLLETITHSVTSPQVHFLIVRELRMVSTFPTKARGYHMVIECA